MGLRRILSASYYPLRLVRSIREPLGSVSRDRLRVLLYHDVAPEEQERFAAQLRWLARRWTFVGPDQFAAMVSGHAPVRGANLLLTFDDGFATNRVVAEQVLAPLGIRALFFVVSELVALESAQEARRFLTRRMWPGMREESAPAHWDSMRWADLEALLEQGHAIGAHTATHARLSEVATEAELVREISESADCLERRLGTRVHSFAYPFGNLESFSPAALAVARRRFEFLFSGLRGENHGGVSPLALRRDSASPSDSLGLLGALLEGAADARYAPSRSTLDAWSASGE
jgi:peptidoglycan/xylan/chitin deacetylase (PgdA/CDA1 family)